jgi:hypothetical protein
MGFVSRAGSERHSSQRAEAGAPPAGIDHDYDFDDPDRIKVHYDVSTWSIEARGELTAELAAAEMVHRWDGDEVIVPEELEAMTDAIVDRLETALGPFAVLLFEDEEAATFQLDDLEEAGVAVLRSALVEAQIPHRFEPSLLHVAAAASDDIDDLLDAIERGDIATVADGDDDELDGVLGRLFSLADRLQRDAADRSASGALFDISETLDAARAPFGVAVGSWARIVAATDVLAAAFDDFDDDAVTAAADELRSLLRPFV